MKGFHGASANGVSQLGGHLNVTSTVLCIPRGFYHGLTIECSVSGKMGS